MEKLLEVQVALEKALSLINEAIREKLAEKSEYKGNLDDETVED